MPRVARLVQALLLIEIVAFSITTIPGVRSAPGFDPLIDGWLQGGTYVTAAALGVLRVFGSRIDRRVWAWIGAALVLRALAFVLYLGWIRTLDPQPYPSVSDVLWLAMSALLFVGLVVLARSHSTGVAPSLWLDGLVGALAAAAVGGTALEPTLHALTAPGTPPAAVVTNLAYPFTDLALGLVILGVLVAFAWRPPASVWLLGAAVVGFAIVDSVFLYEVTKGTYRPGTALSSLSLVATALIALAGWVPVGRVSRRRLEALPGLVAPALFALACLGHLLYASERAVPDGMIVLSALGLIAATVRTGVTVDALRRERGVARAARDEAERANRAKSEFLSRMSHELRTPLNAILGFGQLLELEPLTAEQRSGVDHINAAGRHLLELINEVLDLAHVESGQLQVTLEPVRAGDVLDEAVGLVAPMAAARDVRLPAAPATGGEQHVRADARRLRQVVLNLLANAVKYNREGGEVHVRTERAGDRVTIAVADTGAGIAAADLERLFVPFDRLGAEHSRVEGTGLGLVLAQRMTEAMGGTLRVESTLGHGSTFRVELPAADAPAGVVTAAPPAPAAVTPAPRRTVLYVEDNRSNRLLVERVLARRADVTLLAAERGSDGLELARRHAPDLILLDLHLADLPGEEVLRRLRADPATAELTVVVVSADATPARRERLAALGADGYLPKPFRLDALVGLVTGGGGGPAAATGGQDLVDGARLAELRELDDEAALQTLTSTFLEDATERVGEIAAAAAAGDGAEVQAAAHALMGAADTFGARRLGELAAAMRARARDGTVPDAAALERLDAALEATRGAFARLLGGAGSD